MALKMATPQAERLVNEYCAEFEITREEFDFIMEDTLFKLVSFEIADDDAKSIIDAMLVERESPADFFRRSLVERAKESLP